MTVAIDWNNAADARRALAQGIVPDGYSINQRGELIVPDGFDGKPRGSSVIFASFDRIVTASGKVLKARRVD